jgi:hypothetical protein
MVEILATNYPASLDNISNPDSNESLQGHAQLHTNVNDAIEALQTKVGINDSADANSLDYRVSALEEAPPSTEAKIIYQTVKNNTGSTISKGKAVYVSGASGASGHIEISLSSNATESTSTKTFGITRAEIADQANGEIVAEGLLQGVNTVGASNGDPVWLGTNGNLLFGLANKPSAPAHLVFLGIVVHGGQANTGVIFVKIQNGFELEELHNVSITSPQNGNVLQYNSTTGLWQNVNLDNIYATDSDIEKINTELGLAGNNDLTITGIENKTAVDTFDKTVYRTVNYDLQITKGNEYYSSSLRVLNDGSSINLSEFNIISNTNNVLATVTFEDNSGIIGLYVTPASTAVTARYYRTALKA